MTTGRINQVAILNVIKYVAIPSYKTMYASWTHTVDSARMDERTDHSDICKNESGKFKSRYIQIHNEPIHKSPLFCLPVFSLGIFQTKGCCTYAYASTSADPFIKITFCAI